jgi:hypothetical protein
MIRKNPNDDYRAANKDVGMTRRNPNDDYREVDRKGGRGKCEYCGLWENNVALHSAHYCEKRPDAQKSLMAIPAPDWLVYKMEQLSKLPPPSIEKVRAQWEASAESQLPIHMKTRHQRKDIDTKSVEEVPIKKEFKINCDNCKFPLVEPGALVFSPPEGNVVTKYHMCVNCFEYFLKLLPTFGKGTAHKI